MLPITHTYILSSFFVHISKENPQLKPPDIFIFEESIRVLETLENKDDFGG